MALDTEDKRRSAQQGPCGVIRPVADGSLSAQDRAAAAWFYHGLTYAEPVPVPVEEPSQGGGFWETERPKKRKPREVARDPIREQILAAMRGEDEPEEEPEEFRPEPARDQPRRQFLLETASVLAVDFGPAESAIKAAEQRIAEKRAAARDEEMALMLILALAA